MNIQEIVSSFLAIFQDVRYSPHITAECTHFVIMDECESSFKNSRIPYFFKVSAKSLLSKLILFYFICFQIYFLKIFILRSNR